MTICACHKDDGVAAELRQRLSVLEARMAALDQPPAAQWDDGCLTQVADPVATARMFESLDELLLRAGAPGGGVTNPFACVSDLIRQNLPAVAAAQDAASRRAVAANVGDVAPEPAAVWDPSWRTRRSGEHGCWDEEAKRWETDDVHRPDESALNCQLWCRNNPCTWKAKGEGRPVYAAEPPFMAAVRAAGVELGGAISCLVTDVRLTGRGRPFRLSCRTQGRRELQIELPAQAGAPGGPLATVNVGDLVRIARYGRITSEGAVAWVVEEIATEAVSIAERSSCCADPASLAATK